MELIPVFFFSNMYETVNGYKYFRILLHFGNRILLDLLIFFFLLKAEVKLRLLHDESFTGKMTKIFITFIYLKYPSPAA